MSKQLTKEMFEYFATLARQKLKKSTRTIEQWKKDCPEATRDATLYLADAPAHHLVKSFLNEAHQLDPDVAFSITRPEISPPPAPPHDWLLWAQGHGVKFDPRRNDFPPPRPSLYEEEIPGNPAIGNSAIETAAEEYEGALDLWRPKYLVEKRVMEIYTACWEARQLLQTDPEQYEYFLGLAIFESGSAASAVERPLVTIPAEISLDPNQARIEIKYDDLDIRVETDMLPQANLPNQSEADKLKEALENMDELFDSSALTKPINAFVLSMPKTSGQGKWITSPSLPSDNQADELTVTFAPMVGIRKRTFRARVDLLEGLAEQGSFTTAMESLVTINEAQRATLPHGAEIEDRFHPELLLPQASSRAQRQIALSMERNPLTVVFGPPGTGKTYTIANLVGHLLAQGKRVLITAEKEEALHEVRGKIIDDLQDLVVPILRGTARDKKRLSQSIKRISAVKQESTIPDREKLVEDLTSELESLRSRRIELLNDLTQDWDAEKSLRFDVAPYVGDLETVASAVERDRPLYEWFKDCPASVELSISDEELELLFHLVDPEEQAAEGLGRELPDLEAFLSLAKSDHLAAELTDAREKLGELNEYRHREAVATAPNDLDTNSEIANVITEAAEWVRSIEESNKYHLLDLLAAASDGTLEIWRRRIGRSSKALAKVDSALNELADHNVDSGGISAAVINGASTVLVEEIKPGKTLRKWPRSKQVKEAEENLKGVTVDGSVIDTREEAVLAYTYAQVRLTHEKLLEEWGKYSDDLETSSSTQAAVIARILHDDVEGALETIDRIASALAKVQGAGVKLADGWSAVDLYADAQAVRWAAAQTRQEAAQRHIKLDRLRAIDLKEDTEQITAALKPLDEQADSSAWHALVERFKRVHYLQLRAQNARAVLERLKVVVPLYAADLETDPEAAVLHLENLRAAMRWGYTVGAVEIDVTRETILKELDEVEATFQRKVRDLVTADAWLRVHEQLQRKPDLGRALRQFADAQGKIPKTVTAKSYRSKLKAVERALKACLDAVPAWVMSLDQAAETFGKSTISGDLPFDVVIVDEASQSPLTSAFVLQMADKVTIVGDPYQTSPPSFTAYDLQEKARKQISDPHLGDRLMPGNSLWDVAAVAVDRVSLTEHFRCPPEIIGWAQESVYHDLAGVELEILTGTKSSRPKPIVGIAATGGGSEGPQVQGLVDDLAQMLNEAPDWMQSVGIIARKPDHVRKIRQAVYDQLADLVEKYQIRVGGPYEFQGAQRDLIYLAMSDMVLEPGKTHGTRSFDSTTLNQMNVATSRARQQMRVFYSCGPQGYKPGDVRRDYLDYALKQDQLWEQRIAPGVPEPVSDDVICEPFDSLSEQRLFNELVGRGYMLKPQIPAPVDGHKYRLDFVVYGQVGQVAVEYDGPHHDTAEQYLADRERQHDLERCGWTVLRVHHSDFNTSRRSAVDRLVKSLAEEGIVPVADWEQLHVPAPDEVDAIDDELLPLDPPQASSTQESSSRESYSLAPYESFTEDTPLATTATRLEVCEWVVRIVAVEGPIMGGRLIQVYNKASGRTRGSKLIRSAINSSISSLVEQGRIRADNPTSQEGYKLLTFRLPEQAEYRERELGGRDIHNVPPAELAARLARHRVRGAGREDCYRSVLEEYGLCRLSATTRDTLDTAWDLTA